MNIFNFEIALLVGLGPKLITLKENNKKQSLQLKLVVGYLS